MKRQYLGDSKDSFKWDYHDHLLKALGYERFQIVLMMTEDDSKTDGRTRPELFPAHKEILCFCDELRKTRDLKVLEDLPAATQASYKVDLHKPDSCLNQDNRGSYFADITRGSDQLVFIDPDNGFEPEKGCSEKHISYREVDDILKGLSTGSVVTVFQHHRRKNFAEDFKRIRERLLHGHSTAIYWHTLMFVSISLSPDAIEKVRTANREYQHTRPVEVIA
jgi:hypothetical protein